MPSRKARQLIITLNQNKCRKAAKKAVNMELIPLENYARQQWIALNQNKSLILAIYWQNIVLILFTIQFKSILAQKVRLQYKSVKCDFGAKIQNYGLPPSQIHAFSAFLFQLLEYTLVLSAF